MGQNASGGALPEIEIFPEIPETLLVLGITRELDILEKKMKGLILALGRHNPVKKVVAGRDEGDGIAIHARTPCI